MNCQNVALLITYLEIGPSLRPNFHSGFEFHVQLSNHKRDFNHCTEVRFASFLSSIFTTMSVINPPERKLAKCISVHLHQKKALDPTI